VQSVTRWTARALRTTAAALLAAATLAGCTQTTTGLGAVSGHDNASAGTQSPSGTTGVPAQRTISFSDCSSLFSGTSVPVQHALRGKLSYGCAKLRVPLN